MFITRLAHSYGVLRPEILDYLSVGGTCRVVRVRSLKQMGIVTELERGDFAWWAPRPAAVGGGDDDDDEDVPQQQQHGGYDVGSADYYRHMSQGDWQAHQGAWMGQVDAWWTTTDQRFDWMYDHTLRQMQHLSTRDQIEPHLQIDPFPRREQDYPPYGYYGHLPPGYDYCYGPPPQ